MREARDAASKFAAEERLGNVTTFLRMEPYRDPAVLASFRSALVTASVPEGTSVTKIASVASHNRDPSP